MAGSRTLSRRYVGCGLVGASLYISGLFCPSNGLTQSRACSLHGLHGAQSRDVGLVRSDFSSIIFNTLSGEYNNHLTAGLCIRVDRMCTQQIRLISIFNIVLTILIVRIVLVCCLSPTRMLSALSSLRPVPQGWRADRWFCYWHPNIAISQVGAGREKQSKHPVSGRNHPGGGLVPLGTPAKPPIP